MFRRLALALAALALATVAQAQQFGSVVMLAAAGAGTSDSLDQLNPYGYGVQLGIDISDKAGTIAVTVAVQGKDPASGQYYEICKTVTLTDVGFTKLTVYPGITAIPNVSCPSPLPATWRVEMVSGTGSSPVVTMMVGAALIE